MEQQALSLKAQVCSAVEGNPQGQADSVPSECPPAMLTQSSGCAPAGKELDSLPGSSDNDFVKETTLCPNKTLWERHTV